MSVWTICCIPGCSCEGPTRPDLPPSEAVAVFDDDLFDAEVIVGRMGFRELHRAEIAALYGIGCGSVWTHVARGRIPTPDHYEAADTGVDIAVWTPAQIARELASGRLKVSA